MQTVIIRADSSSTIGTGHIMRDLVLAKRYFCTDRVIFATQALSGNINYKIEEMGYEVALLESNEYTAFKTLLETYTPKTVAIDHYGIDYEFEKKLKTDFPKTELFVVDDLYKKHHCDILLNHNINAKCQNYKDLLPPYTKLLCGAKYTLIRESFYQAKKQKPKKEGIMISLGGSDPLGLSLKLARTLKRFELHIYTTSSFAKLQELQKLAFVYRNIHIHLNEDLAYAMARHKLAIITPSTVSYEALFMGIPFIAIKVADNQESMADYLKKRNFCVLEKFSAKKVYNCIKKGVACKKNKKP